MSQNEKDISKDPVHISQDTQHEVEDDGVIVHRVRLLGGANSVIQYVDRMSLSLESALNEAGHLAVVFDDEDAHGQRIT